MPPVVSPHQVVVIPMLRKPEQDEQVLAYARQLVDELNRLTFADRQPIEAKLDERPYKSVDKKWQWIKKGVPLLLEIGARDVSNRAVSILARHRPPRGYQQIPRDQFLARVGSMLDEIQKTYFNEASERMRANIHRDIADFKAFEDHFRGEGLSGFVIAKWCEGSECEERIKELAVSIRCLPSEQSGTQGACVVCGRPAKMDAVYAKAY